MTITAPTQQAFDFHVAQLLSSGFSISVWQPGLATFVKPKQISLAAIVILLLVGWLLLWIPLIVYLIVFALSSDARVTVMRAPVEAPTQLPAPVGLRSEDGRWWWDGRQWQATS